MSGLSQHWLNILCPGQHMSSYPDKSWLGPIKPKQQLMMFVWRVRYRNTFRDKGMMFLSKQRYVIKGSTKDPRKSQNCSQNWKTNERHRLLDKNEKLAVIYHLATSHTLEANPRYQWHVGSVLWWQYSNSSVACEFRMFLGMLELGLQYQIHLNFLEQQHLGYYTEQDVALAS